MTTGTDAVAEDIASAWPVALTVYVPGMVGSVAAAGFDDRPQHRGIRCSGDGR
jgi:hypothetical protein